MNPLKRKVLVILCIVGGIGFIILTVWCWTNFIFTKEQQKRIANEFSLPEGAMHVPMTIEMENSWEDSLTPLPFIPPDDFDWIKDCDSMRVLCEGKAIEVYPIEHYAVYYSNYDDSGDFVEMGSVEFDNESKILIIEGFEGWEINLSKNKGILQ